MRKACLEGVCGQSRCNRKNRTAEIGGVVEARVMVRFLLMCLLFVDWLYPEKPALCLRFIAQLCFLGSFKI